MSERGNTHHEEIKRRRPQKIEDLYDLIALLKDKRPVSKFFSSIESSGNSLETLKQWREISNGLETYLNALTANKKLYSADKDDIKAIKAIEKANKHIEKLGLTQLSNYKIDGSREVKETETDKKRLKFFETGLFPENPWSLLTKNDGKKQGTLFGAWFQYREDVEFIEKIKADISQFKAVARWHWTYLLAFVFIFIFAFGAFVGIVSFYSLLFASMGIVATIPVLGFSIPIALFLSLLMSIATPITNAQLADRLIMLLNRCYWSFKRLFSSDLLEKCSKATTRWVRLFRFLSIFCPIVVTFMSLVLTYFSVMNLAPIFVFLTPAGFLALTLFIMVSTVFIVVTLYGASFIEYMQQLAEEKVEEEKVAQMDDEVNQELLPITKRFSAACKKLYQKVKENPKKAIGTVLLTLLVIMGVLAPLYLSGVTLYGILLGPVGFVAAIIVVAVGCSVSFVFKAYFSVDSQDDLIECVQLPFAFVRGLIDRLFNKVNESINNGLLRVLVKGLIVLVSIPPILLYIVAAFLTFVISGKKNYINLLDCWLVNVLENCKKTWTLGGVLNTVLSPITILLTLLIFGEPRSARATYETIAQGVQFIKDNLPSTDKVWFFCKLVFFSVFVIVPTAVVCLVINVFNLLINTLLFFFFMFKNLVNSINNGIPGTVSILEAMGGISFLSISLAAIAGLGGAYNSGSTMTKNLALANAVKPARSFIDYVKAFFIVNDDNPLANNADQHLSVGIWHKVLAGIKKLINADGLESKKKVNSRIMFSLAGFLGIGLGVYSLLTWGLASFTVIVSLPVVIIGGAAIVISVAMLAYAAYNFLTVCDKQKKFTSKPASAEGLIKNRSTGPGKILVVGKKNKKSCENESLIGDSTVLGIDSVGQT